MMVIYEFRVRDMAEHLVECVADDVVEDFARNHGVRGRILDWWFEGNALVLKVKEVEDDPEEVRLEGAKGEVLRWIDHYLDFAKLVIDRRRELGLA